MIIKSQVAHHLFDLLPKPMLRSFTVYLYSVCTLILKVLGSISIFIYRSHGSNFGANRPQGGEKVISNKSGGNTAGTEDSVFLQSCKCQFISCGNLSKHLEEPKDLKFTVQEMYFEPKELDDGTPQSRNNLLDQKSEKDQAESDEESHSFSFRFNPYKINEDTITDREREESPLEGSLQREEEVVYEEKDEILDHQDFSYEVEFLPFSGFSTVDSNQESDSRDHDKPLSEKFEDSDDDYIELKPSPINNTPRVVSKESTTGWDSDYSDDDEEEEDEHDVLLEHQKLVRQMKTELKNCRVGGLPTISEEWESPKMIEEDLKPLEINRKIEYKVVIDEIQKLYKSYSEKMRKLDILNYQTLQAISFLQLKESEVFTVGKNTKNPVAFILPRAWPRKVQRIHADLIHKSVNEMHRDLELVYVGQLCLSWEILRWLHVKARELLRHDPEEYLHHSYNRAAEEFQQFQVVLQRFIEDERFQGLRNQNYVRSRCMIRSLLQVPTIKDDSFNKERREERDAISLEGLAEIIGESIKIFREFLFADKKIHGTKIDHQDPQNSELLPDIISNLQKKERRIKEQARCEKCIVKKWRKHQECRSGGIELSTSQAETRLVSRVLCVPRLTRDQLVWCQNKLNNISFVGRKVHVEPSFLLFPC